MLVITKNQDLEAHLKDKNVGFVPTMGALHSGHLSLVDECAKRGLFTVVSIFVNPAQFNNAEDFEMYPVDIDGDIERLKATNCDLVYIPTSDQVYPADFDETKYLHRFDDLEGSLEGEFRPGHFRGVAKVVHRLFELVKPSAAFFGEKDFQQLAIIRALVRQMGVEIEIIGHNTIRENDGLAMSSRNKRLSAPQRSKATLIFEALKHAQVNFGSIPNTQLRSEIEVLFAKDKEWTLEYFEIVNPTSFKPVLEGFKGNARALIAAYLGKVRLIDNVELRAK